MREGGGLRTCPLAVLKKRQSTMQVMLLIREDPLNSTHATQSFSLRFCDASEAR